MTTTGTLIQPRGFWQILREATQLYRRYWLTLTQPVALPWFGILLGAGLWLVLPLLASYYLIDVWRVESGWILWPVFIASNLPGLFIFLKAFWDLLVWLSALNLVIRDLYEKGECQDFGAHRLRIHSRSIDYAVMLSLLLVLQALPLVLLLPIFFFAGSSSNVDPTQIDPFNTDTETALQIIGSSLGVVLAALAVPAGLILSSGASFLFCLAYQVFAFEPSPTLGVVFTTLQRVFKIWWQCILLLLLNFLVVQLLVPFFIEGLSWLIQLKPFLASLILPGLDWYFPQIGDSGQLILNWFSTQELSNELVGLIINVSVNVLLLPWVTCWFALAYGTSRADTAKT